MAWFLSSHPVSPLLPGTHMAFQTSHAPCTGLCVPRTDWSSHAVSTSPNRAPVCVHVTHVPKQNHSHHSPRERCREQNRFLNTHTSHRLMRTCHTHSLHWSVYLPNLRSPSTVASSAPSTNVRGSQQHSNSGSLKCSHGLKVKILPVQAPRSLPHPTSRSCPPQET